MAEFGCVGKIAALVTANHLFICFCRQYIVVVGPLAQQIVAIIIQMVGQETWWVGKGGTVDLVCGQKYPDSGQQK